MPIPIGMRARLVLCFLLAGTAAAAALAASPPPLTPTQRSCVVGKIGKKAFDRLPRDRGKWPKAVAVKVRTCFATPGSKPATTPPPASPCPSDLTGLFTRTPVDMSLVTSIGLPGQVRGGDYKGHGYFRVSRNDVQVVMPADGTLDEGSRYIEQGEVQHLLHVRLGCGLVISFDHVLDPGPKVAAAFDGAPAPKPDDSRTYPLRAQTLAAGEVVATSVGLRQTSNAFLDFGVYDPAKPNAASQQPGFQGDRSTWKDTTPLCWYGMFPPADAARIRSLAGVDSGAGASSDICS